MKKLLSILLVVMMLFIACPLPGQAAPEYRYVQAFMSTTQSYETLRLARASGQVLIEAADLARAADMKAALSGSSVTFTRDGSSFTYRTTAQISNGTFAYVPLKETADALHLRYTFSKDSQTLYMVHGRGFVEDLLALCKQVIPSSLSDSRYFLGYIYDTPGAELATVYGILTQTGFLPADLLTYATGQYDRELYETCLYKLLTDEDNSIYQLEQFLSNCNKDLNTVIGALENEAKFEKKLDELLLQGGVSLYEDNSFWLGYRTKDLLACYDAMNTVGTLSVKGFLTMYHKLHLSESSARIFLDAFNGSLGPYAREVDDANLRASAGEIYQFTRDASPELSASFYSLGTDLAEDALDMTIKTASKALRNKYSGIISGIGIKITDFIFKKNISAVENARILAEIQREIYASVPTLNPESSSFDAEGLKNASILFLRATQCGYLSFKDDKNVGEACKIGADTAFDLICQIAAIDTDEISHPTDNEELSSSFSSMTRDKNTLNTVERGVQNEFSHILATAAISCFTLNHTSHTYRCDFTGDGVADYAVCRPTKAISTGEDNVWCLIQGGTTGIAPVVFGSTDSTLPVRFYWSQPQNTAYISYFDARGTQRICPYGTSLGLPIIRGRGDHWQVGAKSVTLEEATQHLRSTQARMFTPSEAENVTSYLLSSSITPDMIENIAQNLSYTNDAELMAATDINGDGVRDAALCVYSPDIVSYINGDPDEGYYNDIDYWYFSCCVMLLSEGDRVRVKVMEYYSGKTEIAKAAQNAGRTPKPAVTAKPTATKKPAATVKPTATKKPAATTKPAATKKPSATQTKKPMQTMLSDGMHYVVLYKDHIRSSSGGWTANVNILQLNRVLENGVATFYISGSDVLPISKSTAFYVQQSSGIQKKVADIYKMFGCYTDNTRSQTTDDSAIRVRVTIKNGKATELVWEWSPASEDWG